MAARGTLCAERKAASCGLTGPALGFCHRHVKQSRPDVWTFTIPTDLSIHWFDPTYEATRGSTVHSGHFYEMTWDRFRPTAQRSAAIDDSLGFLIDLYCEQLAHTFLCPRICDSMMLNDM